MLTYFCPRPWTVDVSVAVLTYPLVPRPWVVDVKEAGTTVSVLM